MSFRVTYNGQGLLLCWNFIMSSPEPLPIEKLELKLTTKSLIVIRQPDNS
jgi:hypothetical protein